MNHDPRTRSANVRSWPILRVDTSNEVTGVSFQACNRSLILSTEPTREISSASSVGTAAAAIDFATALALDAELPDAPALQRDPKVALALAEAQAAADRRERALYHGRRSLSLARLAGDDGQARAASAWLSAFEGR